MNTWTTKTGTVVQQLLGGRSSVYLVSSDDASILVDTSWKNARRRLTGILDNLGFLEGRLLDALLLTHTHFDHAENAAFIHQRYQPQLIVQSDESELLRAGQNPRLHGTVVWTRGLNPLMGDWVQPFVHYEPVEPDLVFDERLDLRPLGIDAEIVHTPGHSPGSASLIVSSEIALCGDAVYGMFPGAAFPPYGDDERLLVQSWKKLLDSGCRLYLPAHGRPITRAVLERDYEKRSSS
jgi:hydroxyacylglutathione hydrolase